MLTDRYHFQPPSLAQWAAEVAQDQEPTWYIKNLLPADNLVLCSGQAKEAKKSWFCMLVALVCATGKSLPNMPCVQPVSVAYIYREGARKATLGRFEALARGHGLGGLEEVHNLFLYHRGDFRLDDEKCTDKVIDFIREQNIKVVVIDTFAKSFGGDENNAQQIGSAIRQAERIRDQGTSVILVHHPRKALPALSNGKEGFPEPDHDLRGSGNLAGSYETHWAIRSYGSAGGDPEPMMIVCSKEAEKVAYKYEWDFQPPESETLDTATLVFDKKAIVPFIKTAAPRSKSNGFDLEIN